MSFRLEKIEAIKEIREVSLVFLRGFLFILFRINDIYDMTSNQTEMEVLVMQTIVVADNILNNMEYISGNTIDEKLSNLIVSSFKLQLRECEDAIFRYEAKYGMAFQTFSDAFDTGEVDSSSHAIERDFMEWEGFCDERDKMLSAIRDLRRKLLF